VPVHACHLVSCEVSVSAELTATDRTDERTVSSVSSDVNVQTAL